MELQNVENFKYVYIHIGNYENQTDACILVGAGVQKRKRQILSYSTEAYKALYLEISAQLDKGHKVYLEIFDEKQENI